MSFQREARTPLGTNLEDIHVISWQRIRLFNAHDTYLKKAYFKDTGITDSGWGMHIAVAFIQVFNEDGDIKSKQDLNKCFWQENEHMCGCG